MPVATPVTAASHSFIRSLTTETPLRTVLVLGASYAGLTALKKLVNDLPKGWRAVVVDRNEQLNHLYLFPRASILHSHTHKAFIPHQHLLPTPHVYVQSTLLSLSPSHASVRLAQSDELISIPYSYCIYCLGGTLPSPVDLSTGDGTKPTGINRLQLVGQTVQRLGPGGRVLVIGGGALGIQLATDLKEVYGETELTVLHSRDQLLPRFDKQMHEHVVRRFDELGIKTVLGERAVIPPEGLDGLDTAPKVVSTTLGTEIPCDLVIVCTGQKCQTHHLLPSFSSSLNPVTSLITVARSMQIVDHTSRKPLLGGRLFAAGDCADAHGAIQAGHTAAGQAEVAAANVVKLVKQEEGEEKVEFDKYTAPKPAIKVTLGRRHYAVENGTEGVTFHTAGTDDLQVASMWAWVGTEPDWEDEEDVRVKIEKVRMDAKEVEEERPVAVAA